MGDMLRFHKFTIGHAWCSDYGNADDSRAELDNLLSYSPLHNVRAPKVRGMRHYGFSRLAVLSRRSVPVVCVVPPWEGGVDGWLCLSLYFALPLHTQAGEPQLPALLVTTGDHDDRVVPLHSFKVVATLQEVAGRSPYQTKPMVVSIAVKAGHGGGKPTSVVLREYSEWFAFLAKYTGAVWTSSSSL